MPKDAQSIFSAADYDMELAEVWPENWPSWALFEEMGGQWRMRGMDGVPYALDYGPLFARMERLRLPDEEWREMFDDVRLLEAAALGEMRKAND